MDRYREARLTKYFIRQDAFYPWRDWPMWVKDAVLYEHKTQMQRFQLFQFFAFNGLAPRLAWAWATCRSSDPNGTTLFQGKYDASAEAQRRDLQRKHETAELYKNARIMDLSIGRVVDLRGRRVY